MEYPKKSDNKQVWVSDCVSEYTTQFEDKTQELCEKCFERGIRSLYPSVDILINYVNSK